jgi:hypothetical protein
VFRMIARAPRCAHLSHRHFQARRGHKVDAVVCAPELESFITSGLHVAIDVIFDCIGLPFGGRCGRLPIPTRRLRRRPPHAREGKSP